MPHTIEFDRVYIHGDPGVGSKRGIALNGRSITIKNSYISDFKRVGQDAQAIAGWGGPGPFLIQNNYLEGAAENLLFGGASSSVPNVVPSDITIRRNHFYKPRSWQIGQASYAGTPWTVKNLLELKSARRVVIEGKILENNWVHAQTGAAVVFLADTQDGFAVEDVLFANNIVRHSAGAFALLSR